MDFASWALVALTEISHEKIIIEEFRRNEKNRGPMEGFHSLYWCVA